MHKNTRIPAVSLWNFKFLPINFVQGVAYTSRKDPGRVTNSTEITVDFSLWVARNMKTVMHNMLLFLSCEQCFLLGTNHCVSGIQACIAAEL